MRSMVEAMQAGAALVHRHLKCIVAWGQIRQIDGFLEAINGLFRATNCRARGFIRLSTIWAVIFLIAGNFNFHSVNLRVRRPN